MIRFYRQAAAACKRMGYPRRAREDEIRARAAETQIRRIADNLMQA